MNNLIVLAVLSTTLVVHSKTTCNDTYDIKDDKAIEQQYDDDNLDCTNDIKCKNAVTQFTNTAGNLTSNEVSFIIKNSDEEFIINKFKPKVSY